MAALRPSGASQLEVQMEKVKDSLLVTERHAKQLEDQLQKLQTLMVANSLPQSGESATAASGDALDASHSSSLGEALASKASNGGLQLLNEALPTLALPMTGDGSSSAATAGLSASLATNARGCLIASLPGSGRAALGAASRGIRQAMVTPPSQPPGLCAATTSSTTASSSSTSSAVCVAAASREEAVTGSSTAAGFTLATGRGLQYNGEVPALGGSFGVCLARTPSAALSAAVRAPCPASCTPPAPPVRPSPAAAARARSEGRASAFSSAMPAHQLLQSSQGASAAGKSSSGSATPANARAGSSALSDRANEAQQASTSDVQQQLREEAMRLHINRGETPALAFAAGLRHAREAMQQSSQRGAGGSLTKMPERLPSSLDQHFDLVDGDELGEGSVAIVRRIRDKRDGQVLALKVMEKHPLLIRNMAGQVHREVRLQSAMKHPNVLRLHDFLEDDTHIYMLLELAGQGGLVEFLQRHPDGRLDEASGGWLYAQVVEGVSYLHSKGCIHRDLKPDNILLGEAYCPKICDFGWCADLSEGCPRRTTCGTLDYMAPEVLLSEGHGMPVDLWSLGVLLYEILSSHTPFLCMHSRSGEEFMERVSKVEYPFPPWFSDEACHLIHCLLQREPGRRWPTLQVLSHPWITKYYTAPKQAERPPRLEPPLRIEPLQQHDEDVPSTPEVPQTPPAVVPATGPATASASAPAGPASIPASTSTVVGPAGAPVALAAPLAAFSSPAALLGSSATVPPSGSRSASAAPPPGTTLAAAAAAGIVKSLSRPELLGTSTQRAPDSGPRGHLSSARPSRQQSPLREGAMPGPHGGASLQTHSTAAQAAQSAAMPRGVALQHLGRRPTSPPVTRATAGAGGSASAAPGAVVAVTPGNGTLSTGSATITLGSGPPAPGGAYPMAYGAAYGSLSNSPLAPPGPPYSSQGSMAASAAPAASTAPSAGSSIGVGSAASGMPGARAAPTGLPGSPTVRGRTLHALQNSTSVPLTAALSAALGARGSAQLSNAPLAGTAPPRSPRQPTTPGAAPSVVAPRQTQASHRARSVEVALDKGGMQAFPGQASGGEVAGAMSMGAVAGMSYTPHGPRGIQPSRFEPYPKVQVVGTAQSLPGTHAVAAAAAGAAAGATAGAWSALRDQTPAALRPTTVATVSMSVQANTARPHGTMTTPPALPIPTAGSSISGSSHTPATNASSASGSGTPLPPFPGQASPRTLFGRSSREGFTHSSAVAPPGIMAVGL